MRLDFGSANEGNISMLVHNDSHQFTALAENYFSRTSFSQPVFVDQDKVAFLDDRTGTKQVSVVTLSTGTVDPGTSYEEGLLSLLGSATSARIVFGMDLGGNERQQLWTMDTFGSTPKRLTHGDSSFYEPGTVARSGDAVIYRTNERDESTFDIVVLSFDGSAPETWLEDGGQVTPVDLEGDRALVIRNNGNMDSDLVLVDRKGDVKNLTEHDDEQWLYGAAFDREGTGVWLLSNLGREYVALMHQNLISGDRRVVYGADWDVEHFAVSPDGEHIALSVNEGGVSRPHIVSTTGDGGDVDLQAPGGVIDRFSWSPDSSSIAFGVSTIEHPSVILVCNVQGDMTVAAAGDDVDPPATVVPESITYVSWDGREIPGFFFRPEGKGPFPALVEIHGGPESQRRLDYASNGPALQYITSLGIAVLALNVRGSKGYGKEYCHLDDKGKRLDALEDVEYAVKWLRERDDIIDSKIAVYGISYGGFMTLSSLVHHPDLWAAGVEMVGMAHLATFLERTGPWRRKAREAEYGELATDREMLDRVSPLSCVDKISAPLMVFHGRQDARVPLYESEQIVEAVEKRGFDVVLRVYDDEGHIFSKRPNLIDAFGLIGEFLTKHLGTESASAG